VREKESFRLPYSEVAAADLRARLARTRWPDEIAGAAWEYGFDLSALREVCGYWKDHFDWKAQVERLSALDHYRYSGIHFIYERGRGPDPLPLVLTHGWPGSFVEMIRIIPLLTDPGAHGGDPADSFDVVVPSLPGYGYSDRPTTRGMNAFRIAELWIELMESLGYDRFGAQGGDLGAAVTSVLGLRYPERMIGIHLNFIPGSYRPHLDPGVKMTAEEETFLERVSHWRDEYGAYSHLQRTQPQTAAYGLNDSPAALAAWILEKFRFWSDCDGDLYRRFSRDELLTNITLYWMTETIHSSFRLYYEGAKAPLHFAPGEFVRVPTAIAHFPKELMFPPRRWAERGYNIHRWTELPRGGHFAAMEEPGLLAEDIRAFYRPLRR